MGWVASGRMGVREYCDYHGGTHVLAANARPRALEEGTNYQGQLRTHRLLHGPPTAGIRRLASSPGCRPSVHRMPQDRTEPLKETDHEDDMR